MLRKILAALILVPLAIIIVAFAVANRQTVTVSLDPFNASTPAASLTLPLFAVIIAVLIIGVIVGGAAAWLRQSKWRRAARRAAREAEQLRLRVEALEAAGREPDIIAREKPAPRLSLRPPAS